MALVVFDLDGTLVDSRQDLAFAVNSMLASLGARPLAESDVTGMVGEGARVLVERALASAGRPVSDSDRALGLFLENYDAHLLDRTQPYEGIPRLVAELQDLATLAVLTNKPADASRRILAGLRLDRYFATVLGGDGAHGRKPDPAGLLHLIDEAGPSREHTVMIGDSRIDMETARNAGVRCCLVRWGFGFPRTGLDAGVLIAERPEAVTAIVEQLFRTAR